MTTDDDRDDLDDRDDRDDRDDLDSGDPFAAELERRLAPLDEAEAIVDALALDDRDDAAVVVHLRPPTARPAEARGRSWPWLAAALAIFGLSVAVLASAGRTRADRASGVDVGGSGRASARVIIDAPPATHEALRPHHAALSRCALALAPDARVSVDVAGPGRVASDDADAAACVRAALATLDAPPFSLELRGPEVSP